ncbi:helix-turn-helix domain-containing protein [Nonomuraea soli]|uniref:Transcriptional regulator with XRE-family HTH domain n=1 Tax=Nonomuraea soli TaxID=1032476 RepID=A0A7W0HVN5_9ACTN|nr:helix-turn-helix transcriptional regulator [Nonomuraea soli]MBA2897355.1 transcriptional regulator with XRE-family HTH domain [Nonomuraea soli]
MHSTTWDREKFGEILKKIGERAQLSPAEIAELAGRSRSQVNRWTRSENQPGYDALRRFADNLARDFPDLAPLGAELLEAAGYGPTSADVGGVEAPSDAFDDDQHLADLQSQLEAVLSSMSKRDRRRWEREMRREEIERLERWRRLMGGDSPKSD